MRIIANPPEELAVTCPHCRCEYAIEPRDVIAKIAQVSGYDGSTAHWKCPCCGVGNGHYSLSELPSKWHEMITKV